VEYPKVEPVRFPVMWQRWCDLTFLHWRYPVEVVQRHVPRELEVETFDGSAWIGVTPFLLRGLHPPFLPPLPWISTFPETNCRTYVKAPDGGSGIFFFSLDCARLPAVAGARLSYGLPYAWSRMRVTRSGREIRYESQRRWPDTCAETLIRVVEGSPVEAQGREIFLTARFRLYSHIFGNLVSAKVEHPPWPLMSAEIVEAEQNLIQVAKLPPPSGPPTVCFSPGVTVKVGRPQRVRADAVIA
jgi:uncharacterized protein YqjF (DUF2071 family)